MKKYVAAASLLSGALLAAKANGEEIVPGLLSYPKWQEIVQLRESQDDLVVLKNGQQCYGKITALPQLNYNFGPIPFLPTEVAVVLNPQKTDKLEYITPNGHRYMGTPSEEGISLLQANGSTTSLYPGEFRLILLKDHEESYAKKDSANLFFVEMANGDRITVLLNDRNIMLADGWKEYQYNLDQIELISKNHGIHFTAAYASILENPFFVSDEYLNFVIPKLKQLFKVGWDGVEKLQRLDADKDEETLAYVLSLLPTEKLSALLPGVWSPSASQEYHHYRQGPAVGLVFNAESPLHGALATVALPEDTITGADYLHRRTDIDQLALLSLRPEPLFDPLLGFNIPTTVAFEWMEREELEQLMTSLSDDCMREILAVEDIEPEAFEFNPQEVDEEEEEIDAGGISFIASLNEPDKELVAIKEEAPHRELIKEMQSALEENLAYNDEESEDTEATLPRVEKATGNIEETDTTIVPQKAEEKPQDEQDSSGAKKKPEVTPLPNELFK